MSTEEEIKGLRNLAEMGWELSTWAAAINWDGSENTPEYLEELRSKINAFQWECKKFRVGSWKFRNPFEEVSPFTFAPFLPDEEPIHVKGQPGQEGDQ